MFKIIKKNKKTEEITQEMVLKVMDLLYKKTSKEVIKINLKDEKCSIFDSRFGGLPYLGKEDQVPVADNGQQLRLLGQINLNELPINEYNLNEGLIQFWILNNDLYGLDFNDMTSQKESRVIYYPSLDPTVSENDIMDKYHFNQESDFPINDTFKLIFEKSKEGVSIGDYTFEKLFIQEWNNSYPNMLIKSFNDIPNEVLYEDSYNKYSGFGHKLLGYPAFTQVDPREYGEYEEYLLLLQIDSIGIKNKEIMWGDCGICNFFITKKALENKDFSKVLYNWDCY